VTALKIAANVVRNIMFACCVQVIKTLHYSVVLDRLHIK